MVVIGGGVIGLSVAWRAAQRGLAVTVADPDPGKGASYAAAGMITPVSEAAYAERELYRLGVAAQQQYPAFAAELTEATGLPTGYRQSGTLQVAWDSDDLAVLGEFRAAAGVLRRDRAAADRPRVPGRGADARPVGARRPAGAGRRLGRPAAAGPRPC